MPSKVTITDRGYDRVMGLYRSGSWEIVTGVQGAPAQSSADGETVTALQKAIWTEFGTSRFQGWGWLRKSFEVNQDKNLRTLRGQLGTVIRGKRGMREAMHRVGLAITGRVQMMIRDLKTPPNAESTKKRKKSANPLIDTGHMRQSVRSIVLHNGVPVSDFIKTPGRGGRT